MLVGIFARDILTSLDQGLKERKQLKGYFGTNFVTLNRGQMTRTTPELEPPCPNFRTPPAGGCLTQVRFSVYQAHENGGSSVESGFEPGALTTRPPWPREFKVFMESF
ncbi:hypothetical protein AVEN_197009-1 [Araneus ventricosus]|uniref:Uncharacterized protein n=1 Tax=Araneus ventricosus TaxID=182803 RepID=A0A4Y2EB87_ARAVE|nr:hypothetical protein AVEN_197009-1 [Araneus ventricosus]